MAPVFRKVESSQVHLKFKLKLFASLYTQSLMASHISFEYKEQRKTHLS